MKSFNRIIYTTNFRIALMLIVNSLLTLQCFAQSNYQSDDWINTFLKLRPEFSKVRITVDGECDLDRFFVTRSEPKDAYNTIYKDSLCNIFASSGKFEVGIRVDSFSNLYFWEELVLEDSSQISLNFSYQELKNEFDFSKLLIEQDLGTDTLEWTHVNQNHWFNTFDTLKVYEEYGVLKIDWRSKRTGSVEDFNSVVANLGQHHFDSLRSIEKQFVEIKEKSEMFKHCRENHSLHYIQYKNVKKVRFETGCKKEYWRKLRAEILTDSN